VVLVIVRISSRSEGTSSISTSGKDARHFLRDFAAQAVGLHDVHGGKEAGLAEEVGPCVGDLRLELFQAAAEREFFEGRGGSAKRIRLSDP